MCTCVRTHDDSNSLSHGVRGRPFTWQGDLFSGVVIVAPARSYMEEQIVVVVVEVVVVAVVVVVVS